jgi:glycosyltransferase involved in cell wall biosynthesis
VTFATLGGGESVAKGSRLLLQAARMLADAAEAGTHRLLIFGQCERELAAAAAGLPGVELRGTYRPQQLDGLLDEVDVGLMPSIWEEAYGYAGIEFVAKGIPVIANRIGGMVDYVREGETGWLNDARSGRGLGEIMLALAGDPERVAAVAGSTRAARSELVTSMPDHADAMDGVYRGVAERRRAAT